MKLVCRRQRWQPQRRRDHRAAGRRQVHGLRLQVRRRLLLLRRRLLLRERRGLLRRGLAEGLRSSGPISRHPRRKVGHSTPASCHFVRKIFVGDDTDANMVMLISLTLRRLLNR